jgi:hypothetical protein
MNSKRIDELNRRRDEIMRTAKRDKISRTEDSSLQRELTTIIAKIDHLSRLEYQKQGLDIGKRAGIRK